MYWSWIKNVLRDLNFLPSLFLIIVAIFVLLEAVKMGIGSLNSPGPGLMFFGTSCILGIIALHLFIESLFTGIVNRSISWQGSYLYRVIITIVSISVYIYILIPVGYIISTFALLALLFNIFRREKKGRMVIAALGVSLITYLIFYKALGVQLPMGWIKY